MSDATRESSIISVSGVDRADLDSLASRLADAGVTLDREFGWVPLDADGSTFVTRAFGSTDELLAATDRLDVEVYPDQPIGPAGS